MVVVNVALIGAGRIGRVHAANLAAHARFRLRAVCDADDGAACEVAAAFGAAVVPSVEDVFADKELDAVVIASATATHCRFLEMAAVAKVAALCEKPLDLDWVRVAQAAAVLERYPKFVVQIGFNRRFDPGHAELIRRVREGEVGCVEKVIITSRDPALPPVGYLAASGGLFHDMMIHDFDMARAILPEEPRRVAAAGAALVSPQACADAGGDVDTAMAILQTASGVLCHINCSRRAVYGYDQRIEVFGSEGMLISDNQPASRVQAHGAKGTYAMPPLLNFFVDRYADSYRLQLDAFAAAVGGEAAGAGGGRPSFADGVAALRLALAARAAADGGGWVAVEEAGGDAARGETA